MIGQLAAIDSRTAVSTAGIDFEASMRKTKRLVEFTDVACDVPASAPSDGPIPMQRCPADACSAGSTSFSPPA